MNSILIVAAAGLVIVFGWLITVNRFSMHSLYANRLTRCYLGASRRKPVDRLGAPSLGAPTGVPRTAPLRQQNRFTGFDPFDDLPLADLRTLGGPAAYPGPLPLINCALNCLAGDELAYQDRRADAFVMTPEYCGGRLTGYADTPTSPPGSENLTLGRALTISGAALDPNMAGLSAPLTALMAIFNTRLGWWLENPRPARRPWRLRGKPWRASEPGFLWPLLDESLGWTNEKSHYIHLSDGGHFENLGVYELIRRRCRYIIVVDAGTDPQAASDNMATMLRLVRTDFGIRIELDTTQMQAAKADGYSPWHGVLGRICYDEVDEAAVPGLLVYLQATLSGDEAPDLLQYVARHPTFPRQSTLNQFFDESQFECYRALGHHTALQVFGEAATLWTEHAQNPHQHRTEVQALFASLRQQWLPEVPNTESAWIAAASASLELERYLAQNPPLTDLNVSTYPELHQVPGSGAPKELLVCRAVGQMLQVMEIAWAAMDLNEYHAHPTNRGWMNTFRRWTSTREFHQYWPFLRAEYSGPFVSFCEGFLNLEANHVEPIRANLLEHEVATEYIDDLDEQFAQEWADYLASQDLPAEFTGRQLISTLKAEARTGLNGVRFFWFLVSKTSTGETGGGYCCGIACAATTQRQRLLEPLEREIDQEAEFFFWMRGPYRSLGLGASVLGEVLRQIESECAFDDPHGKPLRKLTVYYPIRKDNPGSRLELDHWMSFFFDQGFRRIRQSDSGLGAQFVVLKRSLRG